VKISDASQELTPIWGDVSNPSVGFIPTSPTGGSAKLKAFLNNGFLFQRDLGLDVRVVDIPSDNSAIKFQWKLSSQKTFGSEVEASLATSQ
jgi:hypothetical protein